MSTDNLIELARKADAILGDHDGFEGFETQMRRALFRSYRALARSYPVDAEAIGVLVDDIDAAMFVRGHQLIRGRDDAGNVLHYRVEELRAAPPARSRSFWGQSFSADYSH
jgi:hypothetical protein